MVKASKKLNTSSELTQHILQHNLIIYIIYILTKLVIKPLGKWVTLETDIEIVLCKRPN